LLFSRLEKLKKFPKNQFVLCHVNDSKKMLQIELVFLHNHSRE